MDHPITIVCCQSYVDVDDASGKLVAVLRLPNGDVLRIPSEYVVSMPNQQRRGGSGSAMPAIRPWQLAHHTVGQPETLMWLEA